MRYLIPLLLFLGLGVLLFSGLGKDTRYVPSPLIDKPAAAFVLPELRDDTRSIDAKQFTGTPYLLNVWGSWCVECRIEHPVLTRFAESRRVRVVGYNWKDEPADALRWLEQFGNPFWLVLADVDGRSAIDWGIYGAPETFLVDRNGVVQWKHVGPLSDEIIAKELMPALQKSEGSR